jgi:acetate kinase
LVFTAGIGENDAIVREKSLTGLEQFGIVLDSQANTRRQKGPVKISSADSTVQIWIIPTNEELAIGRESLEVLNNRRLAPGA